MSTFVILICNENQYAYVDEGRETLSAGETWSFSGDGGQIICGTVISASTVTPNYSAITNYDGCGECLGATTLYFTANTIYDECVICNDTSKLLMHHILYGQVYMEHKLHKETPLY